LDDAWDPHQQSVVCPLYAYTYETIIYVALKQFSLPYLALKKLNFFIWHQIEIFIRKWHYRLFSLVTVLSGLQNDMNALISDVIWIYFSEEWLRSTCI
jgi:hypothetical protein